MSESKNSDGGCLWFVIVVIVMIAMSQRVKTLERKVEQIQTYLKTDTND